MACCVCSALSKSNPAITPTDLSKSNSVRISGKASGKASEKMINSCINCQKEWQTQPFNLCKSCYNERFLTTQGTHKCYRCPRPADCGFFLCKECNEEQNSLLVKQN